MHIKQFAICIVVFLVLDTVWLGYIARHWYTSALGYLMDQNAPNYLAATGVYVCLVIGVILFVIPKANDNAVLALIWGSLFGFVCYGVYDITNLAIIYKWPLWISIIDILWGGFLCGLSSYLTVLLSNRF